MYCLLSDPLTEVIFKKTPEHQFLLTEIITLLLQGLCQVISVVSSFTEFLAWIYETCLLECHYVSVGVAKRALR